MKTNDNKFLLSTATTLKNWYIQRMYSMNMLELSDEVQTWQGDLFNN